MTKQMIWRGLFVLLGALVLALPACTASDHQPDRPTGVEADQWYPISPKLGLVLTRTRNAPGQTELTEEKKEWLEEMGVSDGEFRQIGPAPG